MADKVELYYKFVETGKEIRSYYDPDDAKQCEKAFAFWQATQMSPDNIYEFILYMNAFLPVEPPSLN
jgi:hypothetical protein